ncbi:MAG: hotdog fold thioesterase [Anaerolineae bacterium]|nr:hotdog fold thioesterase [Anaerolineae bacterium]
MSAHGIWQVPFTLELFNERTNNTLAQHIGIEFTEIGADYLRARMPVHSKTHQPFGTLHGGASATLAETVGSAAGALCVDPETKMVAGLELNCNHVRPVREGYVYATARPIHIGNTTHIWDIRILDEQEHLVCVSRLTLIVLDQKQAGL